MPAVTLVSQRRRIDGAGLEEVLHVRGPRQQDGGGTGDATVAAGTIVGASHSRQTT